MPVLRRLKPDTSFCAASRAQNQLARLRRLPSQGPGAAGYSIGLAQSKLWQPGFGQALSQSSNSSFSFTHIQICGSTAHISHLELFLSFRDPINAADFHEADADEHKAQLMLQRGMRVKFQHIPRKRWAERLGPAARDQPQGSMSWHTKPN